MKKANIGEWSELYALCYLLLNGGANGINSSGDLDLSVFYDLQTVIYKNQVAIENEYRIVDGKICACWDGDKVVTVDRNQLQSLFARFQKELSIHSGSRTFSSVAGTDLLGLLRRKRLSADSNSISDLELSFVDSNPTSWKSFSIKSEIGSSATVFNASKNSNLTFAIDLVGEIRPFTNPSTVKTNVKTVLSEGATLRMEKYDSPIFQSNIENVDPELPSLIAQIVHRYYSGNENRVKDICDSMWSGDSDYTVKVDKIGRFLRAVSMGLRAGSSWRGQPEHFGGIILVKKNCNVGIYHLSSLSSYDEYLYTHLRLDTPSSSRHRFGQIVTENGYPTIKLNLQIRY